ncbi:MAG: FAD-dependent monooxygenase [Hyphomicrobium sp.]
MLSQEETEGLLVERLEARGIRSELGVTLNGFAQDGEGVTANISYPDGRVETERFGWLVACDGAHSPVRHSLGLSFEGDTIATDWGLGDFHVSGVPFAIDELATYWHHDGPIVFFPMASGRYRLIASLGASKGDKPIAPTIEEFQAIVDKRGPGGITLSDSVWLSAFRINERQVSTYRQGRVFLAGDAAHVHSPAGGQGMNTGMQDAFNLAWKLALIARNLDASPALLDSYSPERHAVGAEVIAASGRLTKIALVSNPVQEEIRDVVGHFMLGLPPVHRAIENEMTEISAGYPKSPLTGPGHNARPAHAPGDRRNPVRLGGHAALHTIRANEPIPFTHLLVDPKVRPNIDGDGIELVRPDGYLAMSAKAGDWDAVRAYLYRAS